MALLATLPVWRSAILSPGFWPLPESAPSAAVSADRAVLTNSLIRIYGLKIFLSTKGISTSSCCGWRIDTPPRIMYTPSAVIIGLVYILLPFMVMPLYSSIEKLDRPLLEAARDLGASKLQTFIRIIIPLTMPGIIAGCLLVMLPAMGLFYVSDLMGGAKTC